MREWYGRKEAFKVIGLQMQRRKGQEFKSAPMWDKLFNEISPIIDKYVRKNSPYLGIYFENEDGWTYMAGKETDMDICDGKRLPGGLVIRDFPAFDHVSVSMENADIKGLIEYFYSKWKLPGNYVKLNTPVIFIEVYGDEGKRAELWAPVRKN